MTISRIIESIIIEHLYFQKNFYDYFSLYTRFQF